MLEHNFVKFNISSEYLIKSLHNKNDIFSIFNILTCVQCLGNKLYVNLLIEDIVKIQLSSKMPGNTLNDTLCTEKSYYCDLGYHIYYIQWTACL